MGNIAERIPATYLDRAICYIDFLIDLTMQLELRFTEKLDIDRLRKAVYLALDVEPILGYRLVQHWYRPYFKRMGVDSINAFYFTETLAEYNEFKSELIDASQGPLLKVYLYHSSHENLLLIKVSHSITDVGGLNNITRIISQSYSRIKDEPDYKPVTNIDTYRGLKIVSKQLEWNAYLQIYINYLKGLLCQMPRQGTHTMHLNESPLSPLEFVHKLITQDRVNHLRKYGHSHNATLNDLLIAAILRALIIEGKWDQQSHVRLNTSVDLRRWYLINEQDDKIANLSSMEVLSLRDDPGDSFSATLERVVSFMERRKSNYIGMSDLIGSLPILLLPDAWGRNLYKKMVKRAIDRNNIAPGLTNVGDIAKDAVTFDFAPESALVWAPAYYPPYFLIGLSGYNGTLSLTSVVRPLHKNMVIQLFEKVVSQLPV